MSDDTSQPQRLTLVHRAPDGEIYTPDAFTATLGSVIPVNTPDGGRGPGKVINAEVTDNGHAVRLTIEAVEEWQPPSVTAPQ